MKLKLLVFCVIITIAFTGCKVQKTDTVLKTSPKASTAQPTQDKKTPEITERAEGITPTNNPTSSPTPVLTLTPTLKPTSTFSPTPKLTQTPTPTPTPTPTKLSDDEIVNILNDESESFSEEGSMHFKLDSIFTETASYGTDTYNYSYTESYEFFINEISSTDYIAKVIISTEEQETGFNTTKYNETAYYSNGYTYKSIDNEKLKERSTFDEFMFEYLYSDVSDITLSKDQLISVEYIKRSDKDIYKATIAKSFLEALLGSYMPENAKLISEIEIKPGNFISKITNTITCSETTYEHGVQINYSLNINQSQTGLPYEDIILPDFSTYSIISGGYYS